MQTIILVGAEEVGRAGGRIAAAASEMVRAAANIEGTASVFLRRLEDLVTRFEVAAAQVAAFGESAQHAADVLQATNEILAEDAADVEYEERTQDDEGGPG